jgi:uncharacterized tellurite resistance protein B-like protein
VQSLRAWLGLDKPAEQPGREPQALGPLVQALDALDPDRARYLAAFAYLLGRVAHADQHVTPTETAAMERAVSQHGGLAPEQAALVVRLAQSSNLLFGSTAHFNVAREFERLAAYEDKLALLKCLFAVSAAESGISMAEEAEIHRVANELRVDRDDLIRLRLAFREHLPGLGGR